MEHGLELIIARLEILEIEVCNILQNPGNLGNLSFSTSSYPGNIGKWIFQFPHILEILDRTIHTQSYPGNSGSYDPISPLNWRLEDAEGMSICNNNCHMQLSTVVSI